MNNLAKPRCKTVYRKAVIYVRADIEFHTAEELQDKVDEF